MDASSKEAIARAHSVLIPATAAAANDPMPNIREAALQLLASFAVKAGSMKPIDKVGHRCAKHSAAHKVFLHTMLKAVRTTLGAYTTRMC